MILKRKRKFVLSHGTQAEAKYLLFGVPDESGSAQYIYPQRGAAKGPGAIRNASWDLCAYHRKEAKEVKTFIPNSFKSIDKGTIPFVDMGDKKKKQVQQVIEGILQKRKFPIMLGGDHSHTYNALKAVSTFHKKFAIVYFDAHPDIRSSKGLKNYATVVYDSLHLPNLVKKKSVLVGTRDIEAEEFKNIFSLGIPVLNAYDIEKAGSKATLKKIKQVTKGLPIYISVDLDVVDPAFNPGVTSPSPGGLTGNALLFFLTELVKSKKIIGLDIMEMVPRKDINQITSHFAAKLLLEFVIRHYFKKS